MSTHTTPTAKLIAKVNARGTVWTSRAVGFSRYAYQMEAYGSSKNSYRVIEEIVVYPGLAGWEVRLFGDPVATLRYKSDAQRAAEELLDNPRTKEGWLLQNTGRIY